MDGVEVTQLYLQFPPAAGEPPMQLKGFEKVFVKSGQSVHITFPLTERSLSIWSTATYVDPTHHALPTHCFDLLCRRGCGLRGCTLRCVCGFVDALSDA